MCDCSSPPFSPTLSASGENEELKEKLASESDKLSPDSVQSKIKHALEQQEQDIRNSLEGELCIAAGTGCIVPVDIFVFSRVDRQGQSGA